jgi:hypothetical protein
MLMERPLRRYACHDLFLSYTRLRVHTVDAPATVAAPPPDAAMSRSVVEEPVVMNVGSEVYETTTL